MKQTLLLIKVCLLVPCVLSMAACAGPTTPFGAVPLRSSALKREETVKNLGILNWAAQSLRLADADTDNDDDQETYVAKSDSAEEKAVVPLRVATTPAVGGTLLTSAAAPKSQPELSQFSRAPASISTTAPASTIAVAPTQVRTPKISFFPKRQIVHGKTPFKIIIDDPMGIPKDHELMLIYNGIDVTAKFLWQSQIEYDGGSHPTRMKITFFNLRLQPTKENKIEAVYWRSHNGQPTYAKFFPPACSAFKTDKILTTGNFEAPSKLLDVIEQASKQKGLNPAYLAGLIAQESGFNSKAVSGSRALGLTQITPPAEVEVVKAIPDSQGRSPTSMAQSSALATSPTPLNGVFSNPWPRYPNINSMSSPILKYKVMSGKIHAGNEWRLNPDYSVYGGAMYLAQLSEYWRKPHNFSLVTDNFKNTESALTQLILASYNSGPTRVNEALQIHGRRWLQDDEDLNEARKYVRRVMSYCDYFSRSEEDENAKSP